MEKELLNEICKELRIESEIIELEIIELEYEVLTEDIGYDKEKAIKIIREFHKK
ncbi:MAG: hypothetical protein FWF46_03235 [Oscillospiraceae bacterium]|nr:hypothetical protein [Oscillospiraceae bacterium]